MTTFPMYIPCFSNGKSNDLRVWVEEQGIELLCPQQAYLTAEGAMLLADALLTAAQEFQRRNQRCK
jgi:hypothetical protein